MARVMWCSREGVVPRLRVSGVRAGEALWHTKLEQGCEGCMMALHVREGRLITLLNCCNCGADESSTPLHWTASTTPSCRLPSSPPISSAVTPASTADYDEDVPYDVLHYSCPLPLIPSWSTEAWPRSSRSARTMRQLIALP